jgi:acyl-coenzyme A synthetase/AMP-(fatty) acid ligase
MYPVCITASICAGGIYSSTGANLAPNEAAYQFKLVRPKVIFTSESHYEAAQKACEIAGISPKIYIVTSQFGHHDIYDADTGVSLARDQGLEWQRITDRSVLSSTTIFILFTSGTSGYPKCVFPYTSLIYKGSGIDTLQRCFEYRTSFH